MCVHFEQKVPKKLDSLDCDFFILYFFLILTNCDHIIIGTNKGIMVSKIDKKRKNFFDNIKKMQEKKV